MRLLLYLFLIFKTRCACAPSISYCNNNYAVLFTYSYWQVDIVNILLINNQSVFVHAERMILYFMVSI